MGTAESLIAAFSRGGGLDSVPPNEHFYILSDGSFVMWRSIAWETEPPTAVGRFAGTLSPELISDLRREVDAANAIGRFRKRSSPDSPVESIETSQTQADVGVHDLPDNAWKPLFARLRQLLLDLTHYPQAALTLNFSADGKRLQLVRQGDQPLRLDLSAVKLHAALWKPADAITIAEWDSKPTNLGGIVDTDPGWSLAVPFSPNFTMIAGGAVKIRVFLTAFDGNSAIPVALSS